MRAKAAASVVSVALAAAAWGQGIEIQSFPENGRLTWTNSFGGSWCYRVEWASVPGGPWYSSWNGLSNIVTSRTPCAASVPMFYRVVGDAILTNGLVAYYPFTGNANDESGSGLHGTIFDAVLVADRAGNSNSACFFDGINDYVQIGTVDLQLPITVSIWFKSVQINTMWRTLLGWNLADDPYSGIQVMAYGDGRLKTRIGNNSTDINTTNAVDGDGLWHMITVSRDALNVQRVYVDGQFQTQHTVTASIGTNHELFLGRSFAPLGNGQVFMGTLDEVRIFNRALSDAEVMNLWHFSP